MILIAAALSAHAYDHVQVAAGYVETQCNIPITVEMHYGTDGHLSDWSWDGTCTAASIRAAFNTGLADACKMVAVEKAYGVHVGPAERKPGADCTPRATRLDTPLGITGEVAWAELRPRAVQLGLAEESMAGYGGLQTFARAELAPDGTLRDLLERNVVEHMARYPRRVSWLVRYYDDIPFPSGERLRGIAPDWMIDTPKPHLLLVRAHHVGGRYSGPDRPQYFDGPFDGRKWWWLPTRSVQYRPPTSEEVQKVHDLVSARNRGELSERAFKEAMAAEMEKRMISGTDTQRDAARRLIFDPAVDEEVE